MTMQKTRTVNSYSRWMDIKIEDKDLKRAKRSCKRCHGTGVMGFLVKKEGKSRIICPCVVRAMGDKDAV